MKPKYYWTAFLFLLLVFHNHADAKIILDKKVFCAEVDGQIDLRFGYPFNKSSFRDKPRDKISSYSKLKLLYLQRIQQDMQIGIGIKVGGSDLIDSSSLNIDKLGMEERYFIIKNQKLGSIECGETSLVSKSMLINTEKIYTAAGGVNGSWANYANLRGDFKKSDGAGYSKDEVFWIKPSIYSSYNGLKLKLGKLATINYISPEIYNFQFGFSYVPGKSDELNYSNLVGVGFSYRSSISDSISFTTAVTGEFAQKNYTSESECLEKVDCNNPLMHWNAGMHVKYFNLSYVLSYGNGGKSGRKVNIKPGTEEKSDVNTYYINSGIAYHSDTRKISATYFTSRREIANLGTNKLSSYALSLEYPLITGASYYFDVVRFNTAESGVGDNNSGFVFLAGLKLSF
ncbi:MAG: porin [Wolbachia endosymbiont of Tyrophagus putrescentiae]|nr:porin [Wolbachia endosymbiont of Tyrophagus putrescentiae]